MAKNIYGAPRGVINTAIIPEKGAKRTGEMVFVNGMQREVFRELRPYAERSEIQPVLDPDGKPFIVQETGKRPHKVTERVETTPASDEDAWREYVLYDDGQGQTRKMYHFRPDPEQERRKAEEAKQEAIWARIRKNPEKLLRFLEEDDSEPEATEAERVRFEAVHKGRGRWNVEDESGVPFNDDYLESKDEAVELATMLNTEGIPDEGGGG